MCNTVVILMFDHLLNCCLFLDFMFRYFITSNWNKWIWNWKEKRIIKSSETHWWSQARHSGWTRTCDPAVGQGERSGQTTPSLGARHTACKRARRDNIWCANPLVHSNGFPNKKLIHKQINEPPNNKCSLMLSDSGSTVTTVLLWPCDGARVSQRGVEDESRLRVSEVVEPVSFWIFSPALIPETVTPFPHPLWSSSLYFMHDRLRELQFIGLQTPSKSHVCKCI